LIIINHTTTKYRNRAEIYASLLRGAVAGETERVTITRLMYASMLSYRQLNIHLQVLLKDRLLEYDEQKKVYKITRNGLQFIELYTKMAEMLEPIT
jgi:predicted transcriptional regulator